ncbi:MAG: helix-turn-helix domain-containing protein [Draconibacterium sp.]
MNINDLLKTDANINVTIGLNDLRTWHSEVISSTKKELEEIVINDKAETYLTPKQVAEMLNVDLTTLWRWNKRNYLKPVEFGGSRRYRRTEINKLMGGRK